jgi:hypothetical protein
LLDPFVLVAGAGLSVAGLSAAGLSLAGALVSVGTLFSVSVGIDVLVLNEGLVGCLSEARSGGT